VVVKTIAAEYRLLTGMFVGRVGSTALRLDEATRIATVDTAGDRAKGWTWTIRAQRTHRNDDAVVVANRILHHEARRDDF
jgi:hypothetical protein